MTIARTLSAAVILAGAVGCTSSTEITQAGPAAAGNFSGTYTVKYEDGLVRTWTATSCGPGCSEVEQTPNPFKARAQLSGNTWTIEFSSPQEVECEDHSVHPGTSNWTWDAATLRGVFRVKQDISTCGDPAGEFFDENPFSLTPTNS